MKHNEVLFEQIWFDTTFLTQNLIPLDFCTMVFDSMTQSSAHNWRSPLAIPTRKHKGFISSLVSYNF
jgi:hypothetical protein